MKKEYKTPLMEVVETELNVIICASNTAPNITVSDWDGDDEDTWNDVK